MLLHNYLFNRRSSRVDINYSAVLGVPSFKSGVVCLTLSRNEIRGFVDYIGGIHAIHRNQRIRKYSGLFHNLQQIPSNGPQISDARINQ